MAANYQPDASSPTKRGIHERNLNVTLFRDLHQVAVILITNGGYGLSPSKAESCGVQNFLRNPIRLSELEFYLSRFEVNFLNQSS